MSRGTVLGKWPAGFVGSGYGLRVAKAGQDANTASDDNLVFSSDWPSLLPVLHTGQISVAANNISSFPFPNPGYLPFASYLIFPIGFAGAFTPILASQWHHYALANVRYFNPVDSYLQIENSDVGLSAKYHQVLHAGDPQGWPNRFNVAYIVYGLSTG